MVYAQENVLVLADSVNQALYSITLETLTVVMSPITFVPSAITVNSGGQVVASSSSAVFVFDMQIGGSFVISTIAFAGILMSVLIVIVCATNVMFSGCWCSCRWVYGQWR